MSDVFVNRSGADRLGLGQRDNFLQLLAQHPTLEVMKQSIQKNSFIWLMPADKPGAMEFFFVLSGSLRLMLATGPTDVAAGDSFYVDDLGREVALEALTETELLYVSNQPMFDVLFAYQADLKALMRRIDEKDRITYRHSTNVVNCCIKLMERLEEASVTRKTLLPAAMFHDVGKCFLPDEILKKSGALDPDEQRFITKHPMYTGRLVKPRFGERVASIAQNHHERLDGSGYPLGLSGDELTFEDRILSVADVFDAMTTYRGYNVPKDYLTAAKELNGLTHLFDRRVTGALLELAREDAFSGTQDGKESDTL